MLESFDGYYKPEVLLLHLWWVQPFSVVISAPLTVRSMIARVNRSWLMCTLHLVNRPLEDGRRALFGEHSAAELLHERFRDAAPYLEGPSERPWAVCT